MSDDIDPATYDAWYRTSKGQWIGDAELTLLMKLLHPATNQSLLDVGWYRLFHLTFLRCWLMRWNAFFTMIIDTADLNMAYAHSETNS